MSKSNFIRLSRENQINRMTNPMMVSLTQLPDEEMRETITKRHTRFLSLPQKTKDKLSSLKTSQKIQSIGQKYGFELLRLANITRLIREYYFGEVRLEDFPREIEKRMGVSLLTAQEIARFIKSEIIDWDPWAEFLASLPKMPIREILKKYPAVGDQQISDGFIEIKGSEDVFDGTIRNWLRDYVLHLGQANKSSIQRMNYVFHTENTRGLDSTAREKLSIILKSFDENSPLPVDVENNEVVLETVMGGGTKQTNISPAQQSAPRPAMPQFAKPFQNQKSMPSAPGKSFATHPEAKLGTPPKVRLFPSAPAGGGTGIPQSQTLANTDMRFVNPYPQPETHRMPDWKKTRAAELSSEQTVAGLDRTAPKKEILDSGSSSPLVVKEMVSRQNISADAPPAPKSAPAPKKVFQFSGEPTPAEFIRPKKNVINPISRIHPSRPASRPEPKLDGNVVDLSE
jgi:hypothetical protein